MNAYCIAGSLFEFFSNTWIIVAMIVLIVGVALAMLAKTLSVRITKQEFNKESKSYRNILIIALVLILIGIGFLIFGTAVLAGLF